MNGYLEWVELAAKFTVQSFKEWQWSTNSIHYLLALWGRLVAAVPYVRADTGAKSHTETLQVRSPECLKGQQSSWCRGAGHAREAVFLPLNLWGNLGYGVAGIRRGSI